MTRSGVQSAPRARAFGRVIAGALMALLAASIDPSAQGTGPGGVAGATLWVRADIGLQVDGSQQVTEWFDQSGSGNTTTQLRAATVAHTNPIAASPAIVQVPNGINFNPVVDFSGASGRSLKGNGTAEWDTTPVSIFAVALSEGAAAGGISAVWDGLNSWTTDPNAAGVGLLGNAAGTAYSLDSNGSTPALTTSAINQPRVIRGLYVTGSNALGGSTWLDGVQEGTGGSIGTAASGLFEVGGRTAGAATFDSRVFNGKIAEVVVFRSAIAAANANNIESYLAIKYGITLRQTPAAKNYTDSGSAVIWNATTNAAYNKNIAGIGRDDASGLAQKQSRSVNTANSGDLVTIGLGAIAATNAANANTFAADHDFLIWGDDGNLAYPNTVVPGLGSVRRMARVWRAQETGAVSTVQVRVPASALPGTGQVLIRSVDPIFDSTDTIVPLAANASNYEGTTDLADGEYFTFASVPPGAPGGVLGETLWLKANAGVTQVTGAASAWADQSGNSANASQATAANRPAFSSNAVNFNPGLDFDGSADFMNVAGTGGLGGTKPLSLFAATLRQGSGTSDTALAQPGTGTTSDSNDLTFGWHAANNVAIGSTIASGTVGGGWVTGTGTYSINVPRLASVTRGNGGGNVFNFYQNGGADGTSTFGLIINTENLRVGGRVPGTDIFDGVINELIAYDRTLTAGELQRVHSYLAIKYGITMPQTTPLDYVASDGTVAWNATTNATYKNNIAGIGRDDTSALDQKQSQSVNTASNGNLVTIGLGGIAVDNASNANTFAADKNFLVWGDDNGATTITTPLTGTFQTRMPRVWKVQETGTVASVAVRIPTSSLVGASPVLLRSTDATFDNTDTQVPLSPVGANYEAIIDFASGDFFTFASSLALPGGVSGSSLWLRADSGVNCATTGCTVTQWLDQSGNNKHANVPGGTPNWLTNSVDFNPTVHFDVNDKLSGASLLGTATYTDANVWIVSKKIANGGSDADFYEVNGQGNGQGGLGVIQPWSDDLTYWDAGDNTNGSARRLIAPAGTIPLGVWELKTYNASTTLGQTNGGSRQAIFKNGRIIVTDTTMATYPGVNNVYTVGGYATVANQAEDIAEVIVRTGPVTLTEQRRIHSYLALKYGISLDQTTPTTYLASNQVNIWHAFTNAAYTQNIAGIGRDDFSALNHKQSRSINTANSGNLVTMGLGAIAADDASNPNTFAADRSFLVWSDDGGSAFPTTPVAGATPGLKRMVRIWRASETGTVGTVQVRVPASALPGTNPVLIRSTDTTFNSSDTLVPLVLNGSNYEATTDFVNGELFTFAVVAPAAPGGVGGGLVAWQKANDGISTNALWQDSSAANNDAAQAALASQPILRAGSAAEAVNFNPVFDFDGTNDFFDYTSSLDIGGTADSSTFVAFRQDVAAAVVFLGDPNTGINQFGVTQQPSGAFGVFVGGGPATCDFVTTTVLPVGRPGVGSAVRSSSTMSLRLNGGGLVSGACATNFTSEPRRLGSRVGNFTNGAIPEFIEYNRALTTIERQQVESYVAIKYGLTLDQTAAQNYLSSLGTIVWDATANVTYRNDITGIGRDDGSGLQQRQSASVNAGNLLTIGLGSIAADNIANANNFTADQSFLLWGRDTGATTQNVPIATTSATRMARIWRTQETGTVGAVVVRLPISALTGGQPSLIRSTDATFTAADTFVPMVQNGSSYEATIDFASGDFFTFASVLSTPGGVGGEALWLRADIGMSCVTDNCTATQWDDQSGNGKDAATAIGTLSRKNVGVNFNPTLAFDAAEGMRGPSLMGAATLTDANLYIVSKKVAIGGSTDFYEFNSSGASSGFGVHAPFSDSIVYWDAGSSATPTPANRLTAPAGTVVLGQFELKSFTASITAGQTLGGGLRQGIAKNGKLLTSDTTMSAYTGGNKPYQVGGSSLNPAGAAATPDGVEEFAEVIAYTTPITPAQHQAVESYLALKYGITLDQTTPRNYVASDGATLMWTAATNGVYKTNIAGIGRDDTSALLQRQSKSINSGEFVTIGLGTIAVDNASNPNGFGADKTFMTWAHDNASPAWGMAIPGSTLKRMPRVWKVQETGTAGVVKVQIPSAILGGVSPTLVRSIDATFDNTDQFLPLTANGAFLEATIDFASGDFFTFASETKPSPKNAGDGFASDGNIEALSGATPMCPTHFWERAATVTTGMGSMDAGTTNNFEATWAADATGDGIPDLIYVREFQNIRVWPGLGHGKFATAPIVTTSAGVNVGATANEASFLGDFNGDGALDILSVYDAVGVAANSGTWVWLGNGDGTFQTSPIADQGTFLNPPSGPMPGGNNIIQAGYSANETSFIADVNADGKLDIMWVYDAANVAANSGVWTWLGNGDGTFQHTPLSDRGAFIGTRPGGGTNIIEAGQSSGESTHVGDFDGDGLVDILWVYDGGGSSALSGTWFWKGNGNGTFSHTFVADLGTFTGAIPGGANIIQAGLGGSEVTRTADVNNDGKLDIVWSFAGAPAGVWVWLGNGTGTFAHAPVADSGSFSGAPTGLDSGVDPAQNSFLADLNGDGALDYLWVFDGTGGTIAAGAYANLAVDSDQDGLADIVDTDDDNDGIADASDVCDSPGSVASGMALWLKADKGTTVDGSNNFTHWADQSTAAHDASLVLGDPLKVEAGINFNPLVRFDGNDYFRFGSSPFVTGYTAGEVFSVVRNGLAATVANGFPYDFGSGSRASHYTHSNGGGNLYDGFGTTDRLSFNPTTSVILDTKPGVTTITGLAFATQDHHLYSAHSAANDWGVTVDGIVKAATTTNVVSFGLAGGNEHIGAVSGSPFTGDVAEVILYNRTLTPTERIEVESYLGTKYGITIGHDYLASDDTTIYWNRTANAAYHNDVAGIGRDDLATLNQKQSGSINPGNIVTIGHGTIEATNQANLNTIAVDKAFLVWGHDNGAVGPALLVPGTTPKLTRLGRVWKVQETSTVGLVTVRVPQAALAGVSPTLIRSTDATFDSGDQLLPMSATGTDYEVTIDLANGDFFTFAAFLPSPGGVAGPGLWVKANDGPSDTTDGTAVATWVDRSGNAKDLSVSLPAAAVQPLFETTSLNFNPAVSLRNVGASNQGMQNLNFLGATNGNYNLDASVFFAHTPRKATDCNGLASFASPADFGTTLTDHPWMGSCTTHANQLALTNNFPFNVQLSGAAMTALNDTPYLHDYTWRYNIAGSLGFHQNGVVATSAAYTPQHTGRDFYLLRDNNDNSNDGSDDMNEAIMYPRQLTLGENQRVESYLAIKYGITLKSPSNGPQDYLNAAATAIWNGVANATYHNNVAGIMADSASALDQRVSNSVNAGAQIAIAAGAFDFTTPVIDAQTPVTVIGDESSVVWGDNNGTSTINIPVTGSNALAAGLEARMARIWRDEVTGTGVPGEVTIRIPSTLVETGNPTLRNPSLLISTVDTFATDTRVVPLSLIPGFYTATFTTFTPSAGGERYFTIAGATSSVVLSKAFAPTSLAIGGVTRLTFTLTNQSPVTQSGLTFVDTLPTGLIAATPATEITSCTGGTVSASGSTITFSGGSVDGSETCTVSLDVTNSASATTPVSCPAASVTNGAGNISGLSTNLSLASGFGACVNLVLSSDVSIVKTAPATFVAGSTVAYTLTVTNIGPSPAAAVTVSDVLPAQLTFVPAGSTPSCSAVAQTVTCNLGTLASGQVVPVTLNVLVASNLASGTVVGNSASVSTTTADPDATNNAATAVSPASTGSADLAIVKTSVGGSVTPGNTFTYHLVVTNNGPSAASNVTVADALPAQVTFVSGPGCAAAGQNVSCGPVASLAPSASTTFDLLVRLDPSYTGTGTEIINTATTTSDTPDPDTVNNTSAGVTPPAVTAPSADLVTAKAALEPSVAPGETFTYRITVTNNGPSTAIDVGVTDALPAQLAFVSSPDGCTAVGQNVTCGPAAAPLLPNTSQTFDIVVRLDPAYVGDGSGITNTATATSPTPDPNTGNNVSPPAPLPTVTAPKADMQIVKSVSDDPLLPGQNFSYTLTIQNNGPSVATNVVVTDALHAQLAFVSSAEACANAGQDVTCPAVPSMAVGATATFHIVAQLNPLYVGDGSDVTNSGVVGASTADPTLANNSSPVGAPPVGPGQADIALVKTTSAAPVSPGETFTYTLLVSNQGPSAALNVTVLDTLPAGITLAAPNVDCPAVGQDLTCTVPPSGTLLPGQSHSFVLTVMLDPAFVGTCDDIRNIATASSTTPDPIPGNNANPAPGVCPPLAGNEADVSITKTASVAPVVPGTDFTYTLTVTNAGPSVAQGVVVTDTLPSQLTFVSSAAGCTAVGQVVTCPAIPSLALSTPTSFDVVVHLAPNYLGTGADILNTAHVATTSLDLNAANDTSAASSPTVAAPSADLSTTKAILEASVVPGGTFTYHVVVTNAGPSTATNVSITDTLPGGTTFVSSATCTSTAGTVTCAPVATVAPAASVTFDFVVRLDAAYTGDGSDLGNIATATSSTPDPNLANNSNVPVFPNVAGASADVSITKTAVESSVVPGMTFSYNLAVSNAGPSVAASSTVTDTLPAGLTLVSSSVGCTAAGQDVTCPAIPSIAVGGSTTINLVVRLDPAYTGDGSDLGNTATVTPVTVDPNTANNTSASAPAPTVLASSADVRIVKNVSGATVAPGETFTYTLTVTNAGPSNALSVLVSDTLPSQVRFVSSPDGCGAVGQSVACPAVASLGVGASQAFTFVVQLDPSYAGTGADVLNSSLVTSATDDPAMANNSSPAGAPPVGPGHADLAIRKDVSSAPVTPGTNFSYTLTVSNLGPSTATSVVIADTLPAGVTFISSPDGCSAAGQDVTCPAIASMVPGASATFTFVVQLGAAYSGDGSDIPNVATVASGIDDPVPANNTSNVATPVIGTASADLSIVKTVVEPQALPGESFTYQIVVTNNGPSTALGVQVTDVLPGQTTFVSSPDGCTTTGQNVVKCPPLGSLAVSGTATYRIVVMLDPTYTGDGSDAINTATVGASTPDPVPANNETTIPIPDVGAGNTDVSIVKGVVETSLTPGLPLTYRLTITNAGPAQATGIVVSDTLPAQVTFVSSPDACTNGGSGQVVTCPAIATLASGASVTRDIVVLLNPSYAGDGSDVLNTASALPAGNDPNLGNNTASSVPLPLVGPPSADLEIAKIVLEPSVVPGGTFTYRIAVTNNGPSTAANVQVADPLPLGLTFESSASACSAVGQLVTCTGPALSPTLVHLFEFVVRLDAGYTGTGSDLVNIATVSSATGDPNVANNSNAGTLPPAIAAATADLTLTKVAVEPSVTPGQTFTYNLTVSNNGPSAATDIVITDPLPVGLTFVSSAAGCTAVGQDVTCPAILSLAPGASSSVTLVVRLDAAYTGDGSDLGNVATATSPTDPTPPVTPPAPPPTVNAPSADVAIVKSVSAAAVPPGGTFTYTMTATNSGPSTATNVVVTDTLPPQTIFVSSAEGCTAIGQSVECPPLPSLAPGAGATFTLLVQLDPSYVGTGSDVLNSALVTATTADPAMANNSSPAGAPPVGPGSADLAIVKDVSAAPVAPGENFTYTLMVSNQGPSTATNVVVTDPLPLGVTFVSSAEGCTNVAQDVTCPTIPSLVPGAAVTFTLVVQLDPSYVGNGSDIQNVASVSSATPDPTLANNTSHPATPIIGTPSADLSLTKSVVESSVAPGGTFTYKIDIANAGPSTALGVSVVDTLPAQVAFVSSVSSCTAVGQTVTCPPIGSLAVGGTATFYIVVKLDPSYVGDGSDVLNTATVTSPTPDPDPADNTNPPTTAPPVGAANADVSITKSVLGGMVTPGTTFTYRLSVSNGGPATAIDVVVTDTLPAQTSFVSSAEGCTAIGQIVTCPTLATLFVGSTETFDIVVQLDPSYVGDGSNVLNNATAVATTADAVPTNNVVTLVAPPTVGPASADIRVAKLALEPSVTPGATFTYRVAVTNDGPSTAANVQVTDLLPVQLAFVGSTSGCTAVGQNVTCPAVPALLPGQVVLAELVVRLDPAYTGDGSDIGNVASASSSTPDPDPTDNISPPAPPPTVNPPSADVLIVKNVSSGTVLPGQQFGYTLTIGNFGPSVATNVRVTDMLPAHVSFVSSSSGCTAVGQSVTCPAIPALPVSASAATYQIVVQLDPSYAGDGSDILNSALVVADTGDPAMANNSSPAGAAPVGGASADLAIVKDVSPDPVTPGTNFSYRIMVTNQGPSTATNVVVQDVLPAGVTFVSSPQLCTNGGSGQTITCAPVPSMAPGGGVLYDLVVQLDPAYTGNGNDIQNRATVDSDADDPVLANNTSNPATPVIGAPDAAVSITKSVLEPNVAPGGTFTYRLVVSNAGPSTALGVVVTDPLPAPVTFVSSLQSCTAVGQLVTCPPIGSLAVGASMTFDIVVVLDPAYAGDGHDMLNIATVTSPTPGPNPTGRITPPVPPPSVTPTGVDIAVTLASSTTATVTGDVVTFTVTATNNGPEDATGLGVTVPLPAELSLEGTTLTAGAYDPATGVWTIGTLARGATATLQLQARALSAGAMTITAVSTAVDQIERAPANDIASIGLNLAGWSTFHADLVLEGTTVPPVVAPGALLGYALTGINRGPTYVVDLFITGEVPLGTTFAGVVPSTGAVCTTPAVGGTGTVRCTWPGATFVDTGAKRTMTLGVRVDAGAAAGSSITGSFLVSSLNPEYYPPSNVITLTTDVSDGTVADLALTASLQSEGATGTALAVPIGVATPLRFTVRNNGPTPTAAASYAIEIPAQDLGNVQIRGLSISQGAVGLTGISSAEWQVGPLAPGASATFDLSVAMQSMRATTVAMRRVGSAPGDPDSANDRATLTLDGSGHPDGGERYTAVGNVDGVGLREVVTGAGRLETPQVRIYTGTGADTGLHFYAYDRNFVGGVRVATCDVDGDGVDEIITGPGIGPGPHVRVLRLQGDVVRELVGFYAFAPDFSGGVYVACGDVDGDGRADVIAGMGENGSEVRVFAVGPGSVVQKASFRAYEDSFLGGARVAAIARNEPGGTQYQIVTVPGQGRPLELRAWALAGESATLARSIPITGPEYQLGGFVDVADIDGDGRLDAVLSTDRGTPALVGAMTIDSGQFLGIFSPYGASFLGGAHVSLGDIDANGQMELLISPGLGGRPIVDTYTVSGGVIFRYRLTPIELP